MIGKITSLQAVPDLLESSNREKYIALLIT